MFSCMQPCPLTPAQAEESETLLAKLYQALQFIGLGFSIAELLRSFTVVAMSRQLTALLHAPQDTLQNVFVSFCC